jgi:hypothetical protein
VLVSTPQAAGLSDASEASEAGLSQVASGAVAAVSAVTAIPLSAVEAIGAASGLVAQPLIDAAREISASPLPITQQTYTVGPAPDEMMRHKKVAQ